MRSFCSTLIALASVLIAHTTFADGLAIRGAIKGTDGKAVAGAEVRAQRADGKGSVVSTTTNVKGEFGFAKLTLGTYKVTAVINKVPRSVATVNTHTSGWARVDFDLSATAGKAAKQKRKVWVPGETGSHIGGRWIEVDDPNSAGNVSQNPLERLDGHSILNTPGQSPLNPTGGR